jgi:hypothetical protein
VLPQRGNGCARISTGVNSSTVVVSRVLGIGAIPNQAVSQAPKSSGELAPSAFLKIGREIVGEALWIENPVGLEMPLIIRKPHWP